MNSLKFLKLILHLYQSVINLIFKLNHESLSAFCWKFNEILKAIKEEQSVELMKERTNKNAYSFSY